MGCVEVVLSHDRTQRRQDSLFQVCMYGCSLLLFCIYGSSRRWKFGAINTLLWIIHCACSIHSYRPDCYLSRTKRHPLTRLRLSSSSKQQRKDRTSLDNSPGSPVASSSGFSLTPLHTYLLRYSYFSLSTKIIQVVFFGLCIYYKLRVPFLLFRRNGLWVVQFSIFFFVQLFL